MAATGTCAHRRAVRFVTCLGLVALLVGVGCSGWGIGQPPVMTLEQWEAQYHRVRSNAE